MTSQFKPSSSSPSRIPDSRKPASGSDAHDHPWKNRFQGAWNRVRQMTQSGVEQTERLSQFAKLQAQRGICYRKKNKYVQELGELAYRLLETDKISHSDLNRTFERLQKTDEEIQNLTVQINEIRVPKESRS